MELSCRLDFCCWPKLKNRIPRIPDLCNLPVVRTAALPRNLPGAAGCFVFFFPSSRLPSIARPVKFRHKIPTAFSDKLVVLTLFPMRVLLSCGLSVSLWPTPAVCCGAVTLRQSEKPKGKDLVSQGGFWSNWTRRVLPLHLAIVVVL